MLKLNLFFKTLSYLVQLVNSVLLIKLYLDFFGIEKTADWLIIISLIGFINLSDFGIVEAFSNYYVISSQDKEEKIFTTGFYSLIIIFLFVFFFFSIYVYYDTYISIFNFKTIVTNQKKFILFSIIFIGLVVNLSKYLFSIFRDFGLSHYQFGLELFFNIIEIGLVLFGVISNLSIQLLLFGIIFIKLFSLSITYYFVARKQELNFSYDKFSYKILKELIKPSLSFLLQPLSYSFLNIFSTIIVSTFYSSKYLVVYTVSRSLLSGAKSFFGIVNLSIGPVLTFKFSKEKHKNFNKIRRIYLQWSYLILFLLFLFIYFFGKILVVFWMGSQDYYDNLLINSGFFSLFFWIFWYIESAFLNSTNYNHKYALYFFLCSVLYVLLLFYFAKTNVSISYLNFIIIIFDIILAILTHLEYKKLVDINKQLI